MSLNTNTMMKNSNASGIRPRKLAITSLRARSFSVIRFRSARIGSLIAEAGGRQAHDGTLLYQIAQ